MNRINSFIKYPEYPSILDILILTILFFYHPKVCKGLTLPVNKSTNVRYPLSLFRLAGCHP